MRKLCLPLIPAILLSLCFACGRGQSSPPQEKNFFSDSSFYEPLESEQTPALPQEPSLLSPEIWDTSDVDISEIDPARKLISFTFDDALGRTAERLLAVFAAFNERNPDCKASATLFVNGYRFDNQAPRLLRLALTLGWELGNHTQSHLRLPSLTAEEIEREIAQTDRLLQAVDGKPFHLLRAPFGAVDEQVRTAAKTPIIDWTIDTLDWTKKSGEEIYEKVMTDKYAGAIVLMHDGYEGSVSALKRLLPDLKAAGYQVVSVSQLIKAHGCCFRRGQVYIRARKGK